jgi:hypothetical protein
MKSVKICLIALLFSSCYQRSNTIKITDFSKPYKDILLPKSNGYYTTANLIFKGNTNDTIIIKFYGIERRYIGKFEDKLTGDYYGTFPVEFIFRPYKATKGRINVEYGIY